MVDVLRVKERRGVLVPAMPKDCPKCGRFTEAAFGEDSWAWGPVYNGETDVLDFSCKGCGWRFHLLPSDRKRADPPGGKR